MQTPTDGQPAWLRCPRCARPLEQLGGLQFGCENGHRFDANKRGYINLLSDRRATGDEKGMLDARRSFLAGGHYAPIAEAVADLLPEAGDARVLDAGCGTGYYLGRVLAARPGWSAIAMDASADAVAMTVAATGASGIVADTWRDFPIIDSSADVILCIFSPRNPSEFARVLAADGVLIAVTPRPDHLESLRASGMLMGMQEDKRERLDAALLPHFSLVDRRELSYPLALQTDEIGELAKMGPSGHHDRAQPLAAETTTVSVDVSVFRPLQSKVRLRKSAVER